MNSQLASQDFLKGKLKNYLSKRNRSARIFGSQQSVPHIYPKTIEQRRKEKQMAVARVCKTSHKYSRASRKRSKETAPQNENLKVNEMSVQQTDI